MHPKNKHKSGYDLEALILVYPELKIYVFENKYNTQTIDFANPKAVKALNTALLFQYYNIKFWEFPDTNLCPPIPGRVDYIHHIAGFLEASGINSHIKVLDIGTGASCIYPILGQAEYGWTFVGTDIDDKSLAYAQKIIDKNELNTAITLRKQQDASHILKGVVNEADSFSVSLCNPPFFKSEAEALEATIKKLKGLKNEVGQVIRNFSGTQNELWYRGGEKAFLHNYIFESTFYKEQCLWFTSLVSKKDLIRGLKTSLKKLGATEVKVIEMGQGNKLSRIVAWTFQ
ncbi:23S rRNA (adenine(1618)-N(6))-methyltransferase RlmF [Tamlana sp. s12]|uniref:23S rRNA (adenine(1618)-N(6))-methyltransferase RlmF n=1 Tax=Tamlana sp. s12 TaxID=1630406 RepID=UPI0007FD83A7|nr:23S rRNA (adenine(1618)-N(6))-methyltransferase RlmF [Tamlana sp. s12]OBQ52832.1 23S rRNA methyltransferase [Tamlana sp. s12]QQY81145.1 23S rRNA (adenine(1618)-N(6))-methyltransferase RlmF [Tamlana sp. s12]